MRRVSVRNRDRRAKSFTPVGGVEGLVSVVAAQSNRRKNKGMYDFILYSIRSVPTAISHDIA